MPQHHPRRHARGATIALAAAASGLALLAPVASAADTNGAAGSPIGQVLIASVGATVLTVVLLFLGFGHRSGTNAILGRLAAFSERVSGFPGWAALPIAVAATSLIIAVFGMYWDISLHIDVGRDPGPLANPAHYFILFGLFGIFSAGYFAIMLPNDELGHPGSTSLKFSPHWHVPLGGVLICACGGFALIGFPLDDIWHRIFGQDVTLWGPTHLMLIGGASMTLIGICVLATEGLRANGAANPPRAEKRTMTLVRGIALTGGLLLGLSTFQGEFDFGIPQFRFMLEPVMLGIAAGVGLVSVRVWGRRGSAIGAVLFFLGVRAILALINGPVLGETIPRVPLYLVSALLVEGIALVIRPEQTVKFSVACGVAIGTIGLASEWLWSQVMAPIPMPSSLLAQGVPFGFAAAVAGALLGGWAGSRLIEVPVRSTSGARIAAVVGAAGIAALIGIGLLRPPLDGGSATVALTPATIAPGHTGAGSKAVTAVVRVSPSTYVDDNHWFTMTAWQGGGLIVDRLQRVGPGVYRTTQPIPVSGSWKALLRLATGRSMMALPVYLPLDTAIPAPEVPASANFTRSFIPDHKVMQREQKPAAQALTTIAYLTIGVLALLLMMLLVWGMHRLGDPDLKTPPPLRSARKRAAAGGAPATRLRPAP